MIDDFDDIDERLRRLASATNSIQPAPDFQRRVMNAVRFSAKRDWQLGVWRVGRYGLAIAALALTLAAIFAAHGASQDDEMAATAYGTVELEW